MWRALMMMAGLVVMAGCTDNRPELMLPEDVGKPKPLPRGTTGFQEKSDKPLTPPIAEARLDKSVNAGNRPEQPLPPEDMSKPRLCQRGMINFLEKPDKTLTPAMAEARLGKPDAIDGNVSKGMFSYIYDIGPGIELELGFHGTNPLIYAVIREPNGTIHELPLK